MVERIWSENSFCLRAYRSIPRITSLRSSLRVLNRPANISFAFFCRFGARDDICNHLLRVIEGRAARRKPREQIPDRGIFLPSVTDVVDRRPCPYGGDRNFRHLDLIARPIGKAGIGGERRALQGESNGGGHSERPTSHVPPPGSPRRARNP